MRTRTDLSHAEWLEELSPDTPSWGVNWLYRATLVASRREGVALVFGSLVVWIPALYFGGYALQAGHYASLFWFLVFAHAFLAANPGIGLLGIVGYCFFIGLGIGIASRHGAHHYAAGAIPVWHYIAGSVLKGTTMVGLEKVLRNDPAAFARLKGCGLIFFLDRRPSGPGSLESGEGS